MVTDAVVKARCQKCGKAARLFFTIGDDGKPAWVCDACETARHTVKVWRARPRPDAGAWRTQRRVAARREERAG